MDPKLEADLRAMLARDEIWLVMLRYSRGIDRFDRDLVRSCYWDDAKDDHHMFVGQADDFIDWAFDLHRNAQSVTHHCLSNHSCDLQGDEAHAETYFMFVGANHAPPHLLSIGRYVDHLQRRDGAWRIAGRVCVIERCFRIEDDPRIPIPVEADEHGPQQPVRRDRGDVSYMRPLRPRQPG